jgi:hypothetical protein
MTPDPYGIGLLALKQARVQMDTDHSAIFLAGYAIPEDD